MVVAAPEYTRTPCRERHLCRPRDSLHAVAGKFRTRAEIAKGDSAPDNPGGVQAGDGQVRPGLHRRDLDKGKDMLFAKLGMVACASLMLTAPARAAGEAELAKKSGCLNCHALDRKILGPAYRDVAAKYRGDAGAAARLGAKVKAGGGGVWGPMPMPPNVQVADKDIATLVTWILGQK